MQIYKCCMQAHSPCYQVRIYLTEVQGEIVLTFGPRFLTRVDPESNLIEGEGRTTELTCSFRLNHYPAHSFFNHEECRTRAPSRTSLRGLMAFKKRLSNREFQTQDKQIIVEPHHKRNGQKINYR